jgi:predicted PurR-regulated permease PerM
VEGNVIEPRLMGRKLGLSTLVVFLSLIFWGALLGFVGAILSIPLTMTLKFAFESSESTRWIAVLLGSEKVDEVYTPIFSKKK